MSVRHYTAEDSPALASLTNADGTLNTAALEEDVCLKIFERLIEPFPVSWKINKKVKMYFRQIQK